MNKIRNFTIIAHIDHGKSTLADRMLEITNTISKRNMKEQVLDTMELERERGITIKMQPARMKFNYKDTEYVLNLIDTPGHIDFSYEVSRALRAVEGSVLLIDSTQGVQAQTLTTLELARDTGIKIIPVVSKIDSPLSRVDEVILEVSKLLDCDPEEVLKVSGKTGEGVQELLEKICNDIPPPKEKEGPLQGLVFDFQYDQHRGIIVYVRLMAGEVVYHDSLRFIKGAEKFIALDIGIFQPGEVSTKKLSSGEIGYIVTGIKKPGIASVGDTITLNSTPSEPLGGYLSPVPVVWASVYPESQDDFDLLRAALLKLKLTDSSLTFEEETSGSLGRGYRCGFLGMLHLEIVTERLRREFQLELIVTTPSITYHVTNRNGEKKIIYSPHLFPEDGTIISTEEPWVLVKIINKEEYSSSVMQILFDYEAVIVDSEPFGEGRIAMKLEMPLRELMRNFFDEIKNVTSGYASISYEMLPDREAAVTRLDIIIADEVVPAFTRIVSKKRAVAEAEKIVEKIHELLPRQMFETKVQGKALGRILSSKTIKAFRKDVTSGLYGGDITRKMKVREKQKKGKKKMKTRGKVNIPHSVFLKVMRDK